MRYGHGQGVRCIVRLGDGLQVQHDAGHFLDLLFYRLAIPGHSLLDLHGGVLINWYAALRGSQQNHPAGFRHADDGRLVMLVVQLFNGECFRLIAGTDILDAVINFNQALFKRRVLIGTHCAVSDGLTTVIPGFAADSAVPMADKIGAMEKMLYGTEQSGSLLQRMDSLEDDVYGTITSDAIINRVDNMYDYLEGTPDNGEASFATKLNVVEWKMNESMSGGAAKNRIEATEKLLYGQNQTGSLSGRLESLLKLASYTDGNVPVQQVVLPKDSVFKIAFTSELSTKMSRKGDVVHFKAADNLYVNDVLVLPKGATGIGEVKKVVQPGIFGKDGRIDIDFTCIYGVDGTKIPVTVGELAKQKAESIAGAAGAAIGGMIILGPVGLIGGAFVKGNSVTIPVGCETFVQTAEDTSLQGVVYQE